MAGNKQSLFWARPHKYFVQDQTKVGCLGAIMVVEASKPIVVVYVYRFFKYKK